MRRQGNHYGGDSAGGGDTYQAYGGAAAQMHQPQPQNNKSGYYQGRQQEPFPETAMSPTAPFAEGQGHKTSRSYYQSQRLDARIPFEKQGGGDPRSQPQEEDMEIGYEDNNHAMPTFEGLEQRFVDDILKLSKEQSDAEDAENARHRARLNVINAQYEEQLVALRARHASRREEFLRRESQAREQQYQQISREQCPNSGMSPSDPPRGYNAGTAPAGEPHRAYNSEHYDSYRERGRFPGNARDHEFEPRIPYPRGRAYGAGSRYY